MKKSIQNVVNRHLKKASIDPEIEDIIGNFEYRAPENLEGELNYADRNWRKDKAVVKEIQAMFDRMKKRFK